MFRTKPKPQPKGFDRAARDALKPQPVWLVQHVGPNRVANRVEARRQRLLAPAAPSAPAPLSRREIVRLRSQTAQANAEALAAVSRG